MNTKPTPTNPFSKDRPHPYRGSPLPLNLRAKLKVSRRINLGQLTEEQRSEEEARILAELQFEQSVKDATLV